MVMARWLWFKDTSDILGSFSKPVLEEETHQVWSHLSLAPQEAGLFTISSLAMAFSCSQDPVSHLEARVL